MIWIDYTIFTILFFAMLLGLANGPVLQFLRIIGLFISFFTALFLYNPCSNTLTGIFVIPKANLLSYFAIFGIVFIVMFIFTDVLKRIIGKWGCGLGLSLFGGLFGIFKGLVFCGIIIFGVLLFCSKSTCDKVHSSKTATQIAKGMQTIVSIIPASISNKIISYTERFNQENQSKPDKKEEFKPLN